MSPWTDDERRGLKVLFENPHILNPNNIANQNNFQRIFAQAFPAKSGKAFRHLYDQWQPRFTISRRTGKPERSMRWFVIDRPNPRDQTPYTAQELADLTRVESLLQNAATALGVSWTAQPSAPAAPTAPAAPAAPTAPVAPARLAAPAAPAPQNGGGPEDVDDDVNLGDQDAPHGEQHVGEEIQGEGEEDALEAGQEREQQEGYGGSSHEDNGYEIRDEVMADFGLTEEELEAQEYDRQQAAMEDAVMQDATQPAVEPTERITLYVSKHRVRLSANITFNEAGGAQHISFNRPDTARQKLPYLHVVRDCVWNGARAAWTSRRNNINYYIRLPATRLSACAERFFVPQRIYFDDDAELSPVMVCRYEACKVCEEYRRQWSDYQARSMALGLQG